MTLTELRARRAALAYELKRATGDDVERVRGEIATVDRDIADVEAREEHVRTGAADPAATGAIYDAAPARPARARRDRSTVQQAVIDGAHRALEAHAGALSAAAGDRLTAVIEGDLTGVDANYLQAVSDPAYERAFARILANPTTGPMALDGAEQAAFRQAVRAHEIRVGGFQAAGPLGVGAGDLPVPLEVDPTLTIDGAGSVDPIRQLADVRTISGQQYKAATSGTVSAHFVAEGTEVSDDTPPISPLTITPQRAQAWVTYSIEAGQDWGGARAELTKLLQDGKSNLEADMWINGAGEASNEPEGLLTGATIVYTTSGTVTFGRADLEGAQQDLDPRYQGGAVWLQNLATLNAQDQLVAEADASQARIIDGNGNMLRRPRHEVSHLPDSAHLATPIIYGNLRTGYRIVDRVGMSVEIVQHVLGANRRPLGVRGLYAYWRTSAKVVVPDAFRVVAIA